ncbi:MAG: DUF1501 domain-containing protein [Caulobacteraceae bacterium]
MKTDYSLGFVDVGGWDTHVNQGAAKGQLADRLGELGRGLAGFVDEIGPEAWNDTVVVVVSEFGRTFRENGNRGTDHGHGQRLLGAGRPGEGRAHGRGPGAGGGRLAQPEPRLSGADRLPRPARRPVPARLCLDRARLDTVFPRAAPKDLQIV